MTFVYIRVCLCLCLFFSGGGGCHNPSFAPVMNHDAKHACKVTYFNKEDKIWFPWGGRKYQINPPRHKSKKKKKNTKKEMPKKKKKKPPCLEKKISPIKMTKKTKQNKTKQTKKLPRFGAKKNPYSNFLLPGNLMVRLLSYFFLVFSSVCYTLLPLYVSLCRRAGSIWFRL